MEKTSTFCPVCEEPLSTTGIKELGAYVKVDAHCNYCGTRVTFTTKREQYYGKETDSD